MHRVQDRARAEADASARRVREQTDDGPEGDLDDTTLNVEGALQVSDDEEDVGGDPYNHTGRFERLVR